MKDSRLIEEVKREIEHAPSRSGDLEAVIQKGQRRRRRVRSLGSVAALAVVAVTVAGIWTATQQQQPPVGAETDHYEFMINCLADAGIEATMSPGSNHLDINFEGVDQEEAMRTVTSCRAASGAPVSLDDAYLEDYHGFLTELYRCLESEGFPVPEFVNVDEYIADGGLWHPYDSMWESSTSGPTEVLRNAQASCPNDRDHEFWQEDN